MSNSSIYSKPHPTTNLLAAKTVSNLHSYSTSVPQISAMLTQAHKESLTECAELQTPPASGPLVSPTNTKEEPRVFPIFKNSHACGSLYAKCGCNNENYITSSVSQVLANNPVPPLSKHLSNPSLRDGYLAPLSTKRLSQPEISKNLLLKRRASLKSFPKTSECLNHPEIPYPIPLTARDSVPNLEFKASNYNYSSNYYSDLTYNKYNSNLEYLRYTALAHTNLNTIGTESDNQAQKFLKESGIIGPMGNGISTPVRKNSKNGMNEADPIQQIRRNSKLLSGDIRNKNVGVPDDYEYLKTVVVHLKRELSDLEIKYGTLQTELIQRMNELHCRETEVLQLQREIHKLKSVLQQATCFSSDQDILTSLQEEHGMANRIAVRQPSVATCCSKKQGVSAESSDTSVQPNEMTLKKYDKDFRSKQQIKDAIMDNNFLKHLDSLQVREIIDSMYSKSFEAGSYVIREGEAGAHLYVSAEGDFEVVKDNKILGYMGPGKAFGELAVLYNCTRTASIRVNRDSKVWVLDRKIFQQIMVRTGLQRLQDNINFLRSVPLLQNLSNDVLSKIADVLEVEFYPAGAYIIRQGASGDTFFIISSGSVKVTQRLPGRLEEDEIRTLERGDYFGEQALLREECRTASVIALNPGVECLTLDRESFIQLIGDLSEIKEKDYGDQHRLLSRPNSSISVGEIQEYDYIKLDDLDVVGTLGIGGFGRVELVQYTFDKNLTFALKCLKKQHIVDTQQQDHILSEKAVMMYCRSPFICRLYRTYRDTKYVYMLLEPCLGGEIWTMLRDRGCFDDHITRFITACVIEAFDYLHNRGVIYRDLKPENLLLDSTGFIKLVDFGFSKRLGYSSKTWTFCGTPEYVAPETILNKGHDRAVDYWALGILMYELLTGSPPFTASDPMKTYNLILKGIDMVDFESHLNIGRSAQSLIKKLCRDMPSERLGYQRGGIQDIKKHKWFQGFDWDGLKAHTMVSPIRQQVKGPCDTSNFDCFSKDNDVPPDEFSDWDIDF